MVLVKKVPSKFIPSRWSSIEDILPPFPLIKNPDDLIIIFDVNLKIKVRKQKRFEDTHNLINQLHDG
jgi:hypothetical protein